MITEWNPRIAAERLINLSELLLKGDSNTPYYTGPCSRAEIIRQDEMYSYLKRGF